MRQGRLDEATRLSEAILVTCESSSEWPHPRKLPADHCRVLPAASQPRRGADVPAEKRSCCTRSTRAPTTGRRSTRKTPSPTCYLCTAPGTPTQRTCTPGFSSWRARGLGHRHADTVRAICHAHLGPPRGSRGRLPRRHPPGRATPTRDCSATLVASLRYQGECDSLASWFRRQTCDRDNCVLFFRQARTGARSLRSCGIGMAEETRAGFVAVERPQDEGHEEAGSCPRIRLREMSDGSGRMIHPRTWSA